MGGFLPPPTGDRNFEEARKEVSQYILFIQEYFAPTFLIDTNTMATHECESCLKETIKGCAEDELPEGMVFAGSECGARRPAHAWEKIGNCITPL